MSSRSRSFTSQSQMFRIAVALSVCISLPSFALLCTSQARADILVIAPHPDDDVITSAGVIYRARHAVPPVTVWVMYMTNGDSVSRATGLTRQGEAVAAEALVGVPEDHLVFLGYPDGSLESLYGPNRNSVYTNPNPGGTTTTFGTRGLGSAPYSRTRTGSDATNTGANVVADMAHFLTARQVTDIFITGGCDRHPDHRTSYAFLIDALGSVASAGGYNPIVHQTVVWAGFTLEDDWPAPTNPTTYLTQPSRVDSCQLAPDEVWDPPRLFSQVWAQREALDVPLPLQVTNYATNLKSRAIDSHQTQGGFTAMTVRSPTDGHISAFVHKDEFFYSARAAGTNRPPVPSAGTDQSVSVNTSVTLDGSGSLDPDGDTLNYQWRQTDGPTVTLSSASAQRPTFTVPLTATNTVLAFELKVSNTTSFTSVADAVSISTGGAPQPVDGGVVDSGTPDTGVPDAGTPDAGTPDAGTPDAGRPDSGTPDAGTLDAGRDAAIPDAAVTPDASADAGAPPEDAATMVDSALDEADAAAIDASLLADAAQPVDSAMSPSNDPDAAAAPDADDWTSAYYEEDNDAVTADGGDKKPKDDSGCALATNTREVDGTSIALFGVGLALLRRRRRAATV